MSSPDKLLTSSKYYLKALALESRVIAIESLISGKDIKGMSRLYNHIWRQIAETHLGESLGKFQSIKEVEEWSQNIVETTLNNWDQDRVMSVWREKVAYIQNWMES